MKIIWSLVWLVCAIGVYSWMGIGLSMNGELERIFSILFALALAPLFVAIGIQIYRS